MSNNFVLTSLGLPLNSMFDLTLFPLDGLTEVTSIDLLQTIQVADISTPLQVDSIATTYVRQGIGINSPPVLFLSGFDSSLLEFRRLLPLLACSTETWAIDLLGFGFTERPLGLKYSPEAIKTHLYAAWQTLIKEPVVLVGASMGGAAAIDFALSYPEVVQRLVLIDSAGFTSGPAMGKFLIPPLGYLATELFLRNPKVRQAISETAYFDRRLASVDAQRCAALHLNCANWSQALISFTRSGGYPCLKAQLNHLQCPTLILWGSDDRILGTQDAVPFQQAIPQSQLIWIPNCGHVPHLENPQLTADAIKTFLVNSSSKLEAHLH
jgi:pimeloyl-ACP methyl ester carboxylesterase